MANIKKSLKGIFGNTKVLFSKGFIFFIVLVALAVGFVYYYIQYRKLSKTPDVVAKEKTSEVIKEISKLAIVPNDPNAVLATVTDITKLKSEKFFTNALNGDYIVLFPSVMKAVLYRPSINKIVEIGPLSSGQSSSASSTSQFLNNAQEKITSPVTVSTSTKNVVKKTK